MNTTMKTRYTAPKAETVEVSCTSILQISVGEPYTNGEYSGRAKRGLQNIDDDDTELYLETPDNE